MSAPGGFVPDANETALIRLALEITGRSVYGYSFYSGIPTVMSFDGSRFDWSKGFFFRIKSLGVSQ